MMALPQLFGQFVPGPVQTQALLNMSIGEIAVACLIVVLVWLALCVVVMFFADRLYSRLIALGIVTAAASIGFGSIVPTAYYQATMLMRLAIIFVLAGVASALLGVIRDPLTASARTEPPFARKERTDV
jgi:hypothetical protein